MTTAAMTGAREGRRRGQEGAGGGQEPSRETDGHSRSAPGKLPIWLGCNLLSCNLYLEGWNVCRL